MKVNIYKAKQEKGVTLMALTIIIIVLIILTAITVNIGKGGIKESKENAMLSELGMVQNAVLQRKTKSSSADKRCLSRDRCSHHAHSLRTIPLDCVGCFLNMGGLRCAQKEALSETVHCHLFGIHHCAARRAFDSGFR